MYRLANSGQSRNNFPRRHPPSEERQGRQSIASFSFGLDTKKNVGVRRGQGSDLRLGRFRFDTHDGGGIGRCCCCGNDIVATRVSDKKRDLLLEEDLGAVTWNALLFQ